jgi:predicted RNA binding protein YcfA (HicA-like mRNA interferase family)
MIPHSANTENPNGPRRRMAKGYYKEVKKALRGAGYVYKENAKGGHEKWIHEETGRIQIIPGKIMSRHTANGILKDIGLAKTF